MPKKTEIWVFIYLCLMLFEQVSSRSILQTNGTAEIGGSFTSFLGLAKRKQFSLYFSSYLGALEAVVILIFLFLLETWELQVFLSFWNLTCLDMVMTMR